jgi:DNA-binding NarL/FixJ family response regulator
MIKPGTNGNVVHRESLRNTHDEKQEENSETSLCATAQSTHWNLVGPWARLKAGHPKKHHLDSRRLGVTAAGRRILSELSVEESSIVRLLLEEGSNRAIAERMETNVQMVKNHLLRIFQKVGVEDRLSLAISLIRNGVVECPCGRGTRLPGVEHRRDTP